MKKIKIKSIRKNIRLDTVYDIETATHDYILGNGVISHNTMEMYSKPVVSGGQGPYLAADTIWIITRAQEKDSDGDLAGYKFNINIEKSRFVREKSKFPVVVSFSEGIKKWSGMFDLALEAGYIVSPKQGWYTTKDKEGNLIEPNIRKKDIEFNDDFWKKMILETDFPKWIEKEYALSISNKVDSNDLGFVIEE